MVELLYDWWIRAKNGVEQFQIPPTYPLTFLLDVSLLYFVLLPILEDKNLRNSLELKSPQSPLILKGTWVSKVILNLDRRPTT